jgi:hypothetical protein
MRPVPQPSPEQAARKTDRVLLGLTAGFVALGLAMLANLWGHSAQPPPIPPVDPAFLDRTASRESYADLVRTKADLSDFKCYVCHERNKPPVLKFDEQHNVIVAEEHAETVKMAHGSHNRNNVCYNCHHETNLLTFSIRDGQELPFAASSQLCGSCHGPTIRDWDAGAHGRTNGYWHRPSGEMHRLDCVNCHNPHSPSIPGRRPAPPPHLLRAQETATAPETSAATH